MNKENGSKNTKSIVTIVLAVLVLVFAGLSGYMYLQNTKTKANPEPKPKELKNEIFAPDSEVVRVDSAGKKVTVRVAEGKEVVLKVTASSNVLETVLSEDTKLKNVKDTTLDSIKAGSKASVIYNGLNELIYLAVK